MSTISELNNTLSVLNTEKAELEIQLEERKRSYDSWNTRTRQRRSNYRDLVSKRDGGYCADEFSLKSRRKECQTDLNNQTSVAYSLLNESITKKRSASDDITRIEGELTSTNSEINSTQSLIDSYNDLVNNAASQGMTPEQAEQQANFELEKKIAKEKSEEARRKMIQIVLWSIIAIALISASVLSYRRFIKKKK